MEFSHYANEIGWNNEASRGLLWLPIAWHWLIMSKPLWCQRIVKQEKKHVDANKRLQVPCMPTSSPQFECLYIQQLLWKTFNDLFLFALVSSLIKIILNTFIPVQTCSCTQYVHFFSLFLVWHRILGTFLHMVFYSPQILLCFYFRYSLSLLFSAGKQDFIGKYFIYVEANNILACMPPVVFLCFPRKKKFHFFLTLVKSNFTKRIP